jgi:UDP:flavonoid glycosyltransferase YjiC (YdhE family)
VRALGVGPEPIPRKKLTADKLAKAIHAAVTQPEIKRRAARLGKAIRAEDGLGEAVRIVQQYLGA